ncbi:transcriptional repressor NrdR [Candidatus Borkfalkia ceftriaxoniphila]|uniref:Transcriptional repressor NrdR n=1 Tax=Candidatus Borkfalkia ceftriaxoniphila TaxID=2508949 RepID=A0A4Q2K5B1_9FIRM|nr:transcriptional regulator NrdR [Candidatus Borkfalkia ceftriaxoniphila]RXZ58009.1 transcriptional repressor NrdR [Candidatus Borkfalkia ceftriaxoniphila]
MKCMYCGYTESKVIDSRSTDEGRTIRRRRECMQCGKRFTTYETIETTPVLVVKNGGNRQAFDPNKIKNGIIKACEKRPVSMYKIEKLVEDIKKQIYNSLEQEITSKQIGEMVMEGLRQIDEVAYVRYASVYRSFTDISSFMSELETLMQEGKIKKTDRKDEE